MIIELPVKIGGIERSIVLNVSYTVTPGMPATYAGGQIDQPEEQEEISIGQVELCDADKTGVDLWAMLELIGISDDEFYSLIEDKIREY